MARRRRKTVRRMDKASCWFLIIAGLFIGTVFTFGMQYWNAPVPRESAQPVTAVYESHELHYSRKRNGRQGSLNSISLHFSDHERLSIDSACVDQDLRDDLVALEEGDVLTMLVHPNSDNVLSMHHGSRELLNFDEAVADLSGEATGFLFLGLFMYLGAIIGGYYLITGKAY